jgi:hypothetical protein
VRPSEELLQFLTENGRAKHIRCHFWDKNYGTGEGNNRIVPLLQGMLIMKLDEDAELRSPDFFQHALAVHRLVPEAVFSPYPVGLIRHPGGHSGEEHIVKYSKETDMYYTLRCVPHVGGLARIAPAAVAKSIHTPYDLNENSGHEDERFAESCVAKRIPMYYLENALIVEHQESTLGQMERYPVYFSKRTDFQQESWARRAMKRLLGK